MAPKKKGKNNNNKKKGKNNKKKGATAGGLAKPRALVGLLSAAARWPVHTSVSPRSLRQVAQLRSILNSKGE